VDNTAALVVPISKEWIGCKYMINPHEYDMLNCGCIHRLLIERGDKAGREI